MTREVDLCIRTNDDSPNSKDGCEQVQSDRKQGWMRENSVWNTSENEVYILLCESDRLGMQNHNWLPDALPQVLVLQQWLGVPVQLPFEQLNLRGCAFQLLTGRSNLGHLPYNGMSPVRANRKLAAQHQQ